MTELFEKDKDYEQWLSQNPGGYVLNIKENLSPNYVVLHTAVCRYIHNSHHREGAFTERGYRKVCAPSVQALTDWTKKNISSDGQFTAECRCSKVRMTQ